MEDAVIDMKLFGFNDQDEIVLEGFGFDEEDHVNIQGMIESAIDKMGHIPILNSMRVRQQLYDECGECAFLNGARLNYPVINPVSHYIDCNLLTKAYYELSISDDPGALALKDKARQLLEDEGWRFKVLVKVNEDVVISLDHLMFILS